MSDRTGGPAAAATPGAGPDEAGALADLDSLVPAADRPVWRASLQAAP